MSVTVIQKLNKYRLYSHSLTINWQRVDIVVDNTEGPILEIDWCATNCKGRYSYTRRYTYSSKGIIYSFYFKSISDKLQFALVWI